MVQKIHGITIHIEPSIDTLSWTKSLGYTLPTISFIQYGSLSTRGKMRENYTNDFF